MKKCAFTICTESYTGIALTLKKSFLKYNSEYDFFIILADYIEKQEMEQGCIDVRSIMPIGEELFEEMVFKYNVTEFCTSIKPFSFTYLFNMGYDLVSYLDPDILFFSAIEELNKNYTVYLTPHIVDIEPIEYWMWREQQFMFYGIYNCGFIAIRNNPKGRKLAEWWGDKLKDNAFCDAEHGIYTDQKWIDHVPSFIDMKEINIIRDKGYDVAPWNFHERQLISRNGQYYITSRDKEEVEHKLVFLHYSGYNYKKLIMEDIIESKYPDDRVVKSEYATIVSYYGECLRVQKADSYFNNQYKYNFYRNKVKITDIHRRLYRSLIDKNVAYRHPFDVGEDTFYSVIKKSKLINKKRNNQDENRGSKNKQINNHNLKNRFLIKLFKLAFVLFGEERFFLLINKLHRMTRIEDCVYLLKGIDVE